MNIDVCFSPALYPVYHNPEAIVVVVDVFRATTTMAAAFQNGIPGAAAHADHQSAPMNKAVNGDGQIQRRQTVCAKALRYEERVRQNIAR